VNFGQAVEWLYGTQLHGVKLGLENTRRLIRALGINLAALKFIHVAGTNGKGSVCAMLDAICREAGLKTGLFTSPHLITFRERIRVNGELISEEDVAATLTAIRDLVSSWDHLPTFFEITTALALAHFQETRPDVAILETGLGGRLDATNVVTPLISVLTTIDFDHQRWLGDTIVEIAAEKAGIIKAGVPVVSAPQPEEAAAFIRHIAFQRGARLHFIKEPMEDVHVALAGSHQRWNAALAVQALHQMGLAISLNAVTRGLGGVVWPGRFQQIEQRIVLDGAHNPAGARCLAQTWDEVYGDEKATLILGMLADKDLRGVCAELLPLAARVLAVPVRSPRGCAAADVHRIVRELAPELECAIAPKLPHAVRVALALRERTLVAGSLFLVGEALALLHDEPATEVSAQ
jgi:dihydrofolate synthase/folylpolyglutamate synthase